MSDGSSPETSDKPPIGSAAWVEWTQKQNMERRNRPKKVTIGGARPTEPAIPWAKAERERSRLNAGLKGNTIDASMPNLHGSNPRPETAAQRNLDKGNP